MLDRSGPLPLPQRIADEWRDTIAAQAWPAGYKLPAEVDLAMQIGVSRSTVRAAIAILATEGLLVSVHGRGTFVQQPDTELPLASRLVTLTELLRAGGHPYSIEVIGIGSVDGDSTVRAMLGAPPGRSLFLIRRRMIRDGAPYALLENYVPERVGKLLTGLDFRTDSLFPALARHPDLVPVWARRSFEAVSDPAVAAELGLGSAAPLMHIVQTTYTGAAEPVEFSRVWLPGSGNRLTTHVRR